MKSRVLDPKVHKEQIIRLIGKTVGIVTEHDPSLIEDPVHGESKSVLWGTLSLVSFQEDGSLMSLQGGAFVEVYWVVDAEPIAKDVLDEVATTLREALK